MRFLLDVMLGTLATYLRMAGHDTAYALDRGVEDDDELLALAREEDRTLVTRDGELAGRSDDAILLQETDIRGKLRGLRDAGIDLTLDRPERCGRCNALVERVEADHETPEHAPSAGETAVWRCEDCDQYFWRGSHWADVRNRIRSL